LLDTSLSQLLPSWLFSKAKNHQVPKRQAYKY
jgi:hypothetical protein